MTDTYQQQVLAQRDEARTELARLHEGEEPHEDEATVPTPAQWIWRWNRATPAERLDAARRAMGDADAALRCFMQDHHMTASRLRAQIAGEQRTSADLNTELHRVRQLLRAAEDELAVHRQRAARPVDTQQLPEPELTVRMMTLPLPACPDCQMPRHGGYTCDEARALGIILRKAFDEAYERMKEPHLGAAFTALDIGMDAEVDRNGPDSATPQVNVPAQRDSAVDTLTACICPPTHAGLELCARCPGRAAAP